MALWIKICGVTCVEDVEAAIAAGADALGINLIPSSKRAVDFETLRTLSLAAGERVELVAVVTGEQRGAFDRLLEASPRATLQFHGDEPPELVAALLPRAFKAVGVASPADVALASRYPGERLLVDAKVSGSSGGTGTSFDWTLVQELARERRLIVAGGLRPDNVAGAVTALAPFGVDVAIGVESGDPRRKDPDKMRRFVDAARGAAARLDSTGGVDYEPRAGQALREGKP
jgi:phosphoribosylanthranilate isomerase